MSRHPSTELAPRARPRTATVIALFFLGMVIAPPLMSGLYVWIVMSGGIDDAFRWDRPEEGDAEVVAAREEAVARQEVGADARGG